MKILFLSTWFPYPPDQGSRIRAYHLLRALAEHHDVALVSFEDQPLEPAWIEHIRGLCRRVEVVPDPPFAASERQSWRGLLSSRPRSVVASHSPAMEARVRQVADAWAPDVVVALTFVAAPYALRVPAIRRVVDVDNLTARMLEEEYRQETRPTRQWRRYLAYRKFRRYELSLFGRFDLRLVTSSRDAERLAQDLRGGQSGIAIVPNGVDLDYNRAPDLARRPGQLVFAGALTYEPNYDAMCFFLNEIFPQVLDEERDAHLIITGRTGGASLPHSDGHVTLAGHLADIRPTVASSVASVVPLRKGGGTRLKILEAMALHTPVVSTAKGAEGLDLEPDVHYLHADDPVRFTRETLRLVRQPALGHEIADRALERVRQRYDWASIRRDFAARVEALLETA